MEEQGFEPRSLAPRIAPRLTQGRRFVHGPVVGDRPWLWDQALGPQPRSKCSRPPQATHSWPLRVFLSHVLMVFWEQCTSEPGRSWALSRQNWDLEVLICRDEVLRCLGTGWQGGEEVVPGTRGAQ